MSNSNQVLVESHRLLDKHFNLAELKALCFALGVDFYNLGGEGKTDKARELVLYMDRRGRVPDLLRAAAAARPGVAWPAAAASGAATGATAVSPDRLELSRDDYERLVRILSTYPDIRDPYARVPFVDDVFRGSPRYDDIVGMLDVSGTPRVFAVRLVERLTRFGQDAPGRETLGLLVNRLIAFSGGSDDAQFLRGLFDTYPLEGRPLAVRPLQEWRGPETVTAVQEKVLGENTLREVRMLELALEASRAVVHITTSADVGSGFLAGERLIVTAGHVIPTRALAASGEFRFNYQRDRDFKPTPVASVGFAPDGLYYHNPDLDVAVVEIDAVPDGLAPLRLVRARVKRDDRVNIIQHPAGSYKKVSMQNNFVVYADDRTLQYVTATDYGSSGAPVFNNEFEVVGVHHSGGELLEPDTQRKFERNAGSTMLAVLDDLQHNAPEIYQRLNVQ